MYYTVTEKSSKASVKGESYNLQMDSRAPVYECSILAVTKEQYDSVSIGDKIEIAVFTPAPEDSVTAEV